VSRTADAVDDELAGPTQKAAPRRGGRVPAQTRSAVPDVGRDGTAPDLADVAAAADFVTFEMHGEMYALRMECVQEIIRMPQLIRVPLGPPSLVGLANLRGRVLPVVSLRRCCGVPVVADDEATRVVVVESSGAFLGLVVDRVSAVTTAEETDVEDASAVRRAVRSQLLSAIVRTGDRMVAVLDVDRLVDSEFAVLTRTEGGSGAGPAPAADPAGGEGGGVVELVSFSVDGQEYALPIDRVREIVQAPDRVTVVPNADPRVLGVIELRGDLLPVISLRRILGLSCRGLEPQHRIVVTSVAGGGGEGLVGLVLDTVREVLRVPAGLISGLPAVVNGGYRGREVSSVCRLDDGARLVSVLSVDALVESADLESLAREVPDGGEGASGGQVGNESGEEPAEVDSGDVRGDDELLVVFRLEGEEYCVDIDSVQEIIRVPEVLVRVPGALDFVEGLVNLRGTVLPVVDLRTRLGLGRAGRDEHQRIIVLIIDGVRTGFVVDSVAEVLRVGARDLEAAPRLSEEQATLVTRVANLAGARRMLMVLDPGRLLPAEQVELLAADLAARELV
jgi:purine-binding chemotaxis protein CheW